MHTLTARLAEGQERDIWWTRATAIWPDFDGYVSKTTRRIPLVLLEPLTH